MRAIVYEGPLNIGLQDRPEPSLRDAGDVLVRVEATGICGTDRNIYLGRFPAKRGVILGHEAVGVLHRVGDAVRDLRPGDRVIVNPTLHCGRCQRCLRGAINFCDNKAGTEIGVDRDGTFAAMSILPEGFVHRIPEGMSFERAVLVEPLACVMHNANAAALAADDTVVVLGAGPIGLLWALFAARSALRVTIVETDPFRRSFARKFIDRVVDAGRDEDLSAIIDANGARRPSLVVDTTGVKLAEAIALVDKGGRVLPMGFHASHEERIRPLDITSRGIRIIGAGDYNSHIFPAALEVAATMELERLVTHQFPLEEHGRAFQLLAGASARDGGAYGAMKIVLRSN